MNSINSSQNDFNKTKKILDEKKTLLNNTNLANFKDTLSVFSFNNNSTNFEKKRYSTVNIKVKEKQEYEFPNIKTMQKELSQKIYSKESGEIINAVKESNDYLRTHTNPSFKPEFTTTTNWGGLNTLAKTNISSKKKKILFKLFNFRFYH